MALGDGCRPFPRSTHRLRPLLGAAREPVAPIRPGPTSRNRPSHRFVHDNQDHFLGRPTARPAAWVRAVATGWAGERVRDLLYPWFDARTPAAEVLDPTASVQQRGNPHLPQTCAAAALSQSRSLSLISHISQRAWQPKGFAPRLPPGNGATSSASPTTTWPPRCAAPPCPCVSPRQLPACIVHVLNVRVLCTQEKQSATGEGQWAMGDERRGDARRPGDG